MIRYLFFFLVLFMTSLSCRNRGNTQKANETGEVVQMDTTQTEKPKRTITEENNIQAGESVSFESQGELYNPYDFLLEVKAIKALLSSGVEVKQQDVDDEYGPYTYTVIHYQDTELSFYDYEGSHKAKITTPKLSVLNGIKVGMKKEDFMKAMKYDAEKVGKATIFNLTDDYGNFEFLFRADTLYLIKGYYEEGN